MAVEEIVVFALTELCSAYKRSNENKILDNVFVYVYVYVCVHTFRMKEKDYFNGVVDYRDDGVGLVKVF